MNKSFCSFVFSFVTLLFSTFTLAQGITVEEGSQLLYQIVTFDEKGKELVPGKKEDFKAVIKKSSDGYKIHFAAGRIEEYDTEHRLIGVVLPRGNQIKYESSKIFDWISVSKDLSVGKKSGLTYTIDTQNCGLTTRTYPETLVGEKTVSLKVKGTESSYKVMSFLFTGQWSGSCGSGKFIQEIVFSPTLNLVLESKTLSYLPSGFLSQGSKRILLAID